MRSEELVLNNKLKVDFYGWSLQDEPGKLVEIHKDNLLVDYEYQRSTRDRKVLRIARDWSWIACGAIVVADRNGILYVIDGQHRVMAARKRSDITSLPCVVFRSKGMAQEAKGFLTAQTERKPITAAEKIQAMLVLRDEHALLLQKLAHQSGRRLSGASGATGIKCIGSLLKMAKKDQQTLINVWPLVTEISHGRQLHERLVEGLWYLERSIPGKSLTQQEWKRRLLKAGYDALVEGTAKASAFFARGGARVWAQGIVEVINKGHRIRLEMDINKDAEGEA